MALFASAEIELATTVSKLAYCNPFHAERMELEARALGAARVGYERFLNVRPGEGGAELEENVRRLTERVGRLVEATRTRLLDGRGATERERVLYEDVALFYLYHSHHLQFRRWIQSALAGSGGRHGSFYEEFERDALHLLRLPGVALPHDDPPEHLFAFFFQLNRAFVHIYMYLAGGSPAAAGLRGAVWQSIFTHDPRRYRRVLYQRLGDVSTLITGPSGTGKELVARAIGLSRYIPFDRGSRAFQDDFTRVLHALNLSALSPTLIESELFGHRRGAFTGALEDRKGWFEVCPAVGAVFLDEIGDLDGAIQVKLLRVLQTRTFQRLGDTENRGFLGKAIAATNRDLAREITAGRFREDLYYRLCADMIVTPSLQEQLTDAAELGHLVRHVAARLCGEDEADPLTAEVVEWVERRLGPSYPWPGNFRELEQCVRNVLIRGEYRPQAMGPDGDDFLRGVAEGTLSADDLLNGYCRIVHARSGSLAEAARRLGLDRRTVRSRVGRTSG